MDQPVEPRTNNTVNVLNLVEGKEVMLSGEFDDFTVHYAETCVVPAGVKAYRTSPSPDSQVCVLITSIK